MTVAVTQRTGPSGQWLWLLLTGFGKGTIWILPSKAAALHWLSYLWTMAGHRVSQIVCGFSLCDSFHSFPLSKLVSLKFGRFGTATNHSGFYSRDWTVTLSPVTLAVTAGTVNGGQWQRLLLNGLGIAANDSGCYSEDLAWKSMPVFLRLEGYTGMVKIQNPCL